MPATRRLCSQCQSPLSKARLAKNKRKCYSCEVTAKHEAKAKAHDRRVSAVYGLQPGEYQLLLESQDGRCVICLRATGRTKRLSVDHDHSLTGRLSVRGLLCTPCNQMVGHARDDPEFFNRAAEYLRNPPAREVLE